MKLRKEIAMLDEQILKAESGGAVVSDVVRGSQKHIPFAMRRISITGYGADDIPVLSARKSRLAAECRRIEQFVDSVNDGVIRMLLIHRYLEGMSVAAVAESLGYSERHIRRMVEKFFINMSAYVLVCP
jgi:hypothetical protein